MRRVPYTLSYEKIYNGHGLVIAEGARVFAYTLMIEQNDSPGDWVIEFCAYESENWKLLAYVEALPSAIEALCELVASNCIAIQGEEFFTEKNGDIAFEPRLAVGTAKDEVGCLTFRFEANSAHYRLRNMKTTEIISGDAL